MKNFLIPITIIYFFNWDLEAADYEHYTRQQLKSFFSYFEAEDFNEAGKNQIINNLIVNLDLPKNSNIPIEMLEALKGDYASFIGSKHPVKFAFKRAYQNNQDIEKTLELFNLEVEQLAKFLELKRIDGNSYLPLAAIIITLAWDNNFHHFLQNQYRLLEAGDLQLNGGSWGKYAYALTTLNGAATYVLNYIRAFTETSATAELQALNSRGSAEGQALRNRSRLSITNRSGEVFFPIEFLQPLVPRQVVSNIKNVDIMLKEMPENFIKIILKSAPYTHQAIKTDLQTYYTNIVQIDKLIDSILSYDSPQDRLAGILLELATWCQVGLQVWDQIEDQIEGQLWNHVEAERRADARDKARAQVAEQVGFELMDKLWYQITNHVDVQIVDKVQEQVEMHLWNESETWVNKDLQNFNFIRAFEAGILPGTLKHAVDHTFMIYQLETFAFRQSKPFKYIQSNIANSLLDLMTDEQILSMLNKLNIPMATKGNEFIRTQLKLLKKHSSF